MVKLNDIYNVLHGIFTGIVTVNITLFFILLQCSEDDFGVKDSGTFDNDSSHYAQLFKLDFFNRVLKIGKIFVDSVAYTFTT